MSKRDKPPHECITGDHSDCLKAGSPWIETIDDLRARFIQAEKWAESSGDAIQDAFALIPEYAVAGDSIAKALRRTLDKHNSEVADLGQELAYYKRVAADQAAALKKAGIEIESELERKAWELHSGTGYLPNIAFEKARAFLDYRAKLREEEKEKAK